MYNSKIKCFAKNNPAPAYTWRSTLRKERETASGTNCSVRRSTHLGQKKNLGKELMNVFLTTV